MKDQKINYNELVNVLKLAAIHIASIEKQEKIVELRKLIDANPIVPAVLKHHFNISYRGVQRLLRKIDLAVLGKKINSVELTPDIQNLKFNQVDIAAVEKNFQAALQKQNQHQKVVRVKIRKDEKSNAGTGRTFEKKVQNPTTDLEILMTVCLAIKKNKPEILKKLLPALTEEKIGEVRSPELNNTLLHNALSNTDQETCMHLLIYFPKNLLNLPNNEKFTPLHMAAEKGYLTVVKYLVNALPKSQLNEKNFEGVTPIQIAASRGHSEIVQVILSKAGAELLDEISHQDFTLLHIAAYSGHTNVLQVLAPQLNDTQLLHQTSKGGTSLFLAAQQGFREAVLFLANYLKKRALLTDELCIDAFTRAVESNHGGVVEAIVPFINDEKSKNLNCLLHCIHRDCDKELFKHLVSIIPCFSRKEYAKERLHVLCGAAQENRSKLIEILMDMPQISEINQKWEGSFTPFQLAVRVGSLDVVKTLIRKFSNQPVLLKKLLNETDENDNTALHIAAFQTNNELFKYLINIYYKLKLNLNRPTRMMGTPLRYVMAEQNLERIKILLEFLDANQINEIYRFTPSKDFVDNLIASYRDTVNEDKFGLNRILCLDECVEDLSKRKISFPTIDYPPPLHEAIMRHCLGVAEIILETKKAKIDLAYCGATALHFAVATKNEKLIRLLLKFNANVNIKEPHMGLNALELAYLHFPPEHDLITQLKKRAEETKIADTVITKTPKELKALYGESKFSFIAQWDMFSKTFQTADQERSNSMRVPQTLEDSQKEKSHRYQTNLFDEKNFSSNQSFYPTPAKIKKELEQKHYYKSDSSRFGTDKPVYIHVTDDAIQTAKVHGAWEYNEIQLQKEVKFTTGGSSDRMGIKKLSDGRHELANKAGNGVGDFRLYASKPLEEKEIIIQGKKIMALVLTFDSCAKSHGELQRKSGLPKCDTRMN